MLPGRRYFNSIDRGLLRPNTPLETVRDNGAMLVFDAGQGYGQRAAREAGGEGGEREERQRH